MKAKFTRRIHPFDVPGRVSLHRTLGYASKLTQGYVAYVVDFFLFLFLWFVVKPGMLLLIYLDLFTQMAWSFANLIIMGMFESAPVVLLSSFMYYPNSLMTRRMSGPVFLQKLSILSPSQFETLRGCWRSLCAIFSFSLLKGFFTRPKKFNLQAAKDESLQQVSVMYRAFKHAL
jgi:hypothetical protein